MLKEGSFESVDDIRTIFQELFKRLKMENENFYNLTLYYLRIAFIVIFSSYLKEE